MPQSKTLLVVGFIIAALGGVGIGAISVYAWQRSEIKQLRQEFETNNQQLQQQVQQLQEQVTTARKSTPEGETAPVDERTLLTYKNVTNYNNPEDPQCEAKFNQAEADTTVKYESKKWGFSAEIPYNQQWASDEFRIDPYEEIKSQPGDGPPNLNGVVVFGNFSVFEGCSWVRSHYIDIIDARTSAEAIADIKEQNAEFLVTPPKKTTLGDLTVVEYGTSGLCEMPAIEVIGEKYNYVFRPICGDAKDFDDLGEIVATVELI